MAKKLGQYFTENITLQNKVVEFIKNDPDVVLEPSVGQGDLVLATLSKFPTIKFDLYEIDRTINFKVDKSTIFLEIFSNKIFLGDTKQL